MEVGADDSILSTATVSKAKGTKGGKKGSRAKKTAANKKPTAKAPEEPTLASSFIEPEDDDFSVKIEMSPESAPKGRKRQSNQISKASDSPDIDEDMSQQPPTKRRATRARGSVLPSHQMHAAESKADEDVLMDDAANREAPATTTSKRGRKGNRKQSTARSRKASAMSTASKASLRTPITENPEDLDAELELDLDRPLTDEEDAAEPAKARESKGRRLTRTKPGSKAATASIAPTRRTTRASTIPPDNSVMVIDEPHSQTINADSEVVNDIDSVINRDVENEVMELEPKRGKRSGKKDLRKPSANTIQDGELEQPAKDAAQGSVQGKGATHKPQPRSRQVSRQKPSRAARASTVSTSQEVALDAEESSHVEQTLADDSGHETDASVAAKSRGKAKKGNASKQGKKAKKGQQQARKLEEIHRPEDSDDAKHQNSQLAAPPIPKADTETDAPEPATPDKKAKTAAKPSKKAGKGRKATAKHQTSEKDNVPQSPIPDVSCTPAEPERVTPAPSPQSSDVENQPPSSRPSAIRPPLTVLSPSGPQPQRFPLAISTPITSPSKNSFSKLQTAMPWTATDLESIFLGTPIAGKENDPLALGAKIGDHILSSPEKILSVEQWIQLNAQRGEERLRAECERIVGKFEGEGMRALRTLEGIVCSE